MILNSHLTQCRSCGINSPLGTMQLQPKTSRKPQHNIWTSLLSGLMLIKCSRENKNVFETKTRVSANKSFLHFTIGIRLFLLLLLGVGIVLCSSENGNYVLLAEPLLHVHVAT